VVDALRHQLSHRNVWEAFVDEMRGAFGHAPPATTRTEPAAIAGEGPKPLGRAARAPEPRAPPPRSLGGRAKTGHFVDG